MKSPTSCKIVFVNIVCIATIALLYKLFSIPDTATASGTSYLTNTEMDSPVIINATARHTASVIFLHGLGDTGHGWSQTFAQIRKPYIKYICPTASVMPVSLNRGFRMPSWFDIKGLEPGADEDEEGIKAASDTLQKYIDAEEKAGVARNRILVGGFSQGGAVALYSALTVPKPPLAGILALSTWLPLHKTFSQSVQANQDTPILQCHGDSDPLIHPSFGKLTADRLKALNSKHEYKIYEDMGHSSSVEEMGDVKQFIDKCLPPQ